VYLYHVIAHDFAKAEQKFNLLEYYYKKQGAASGNQPAFYSLHLLYLFASNKEVEFYCMLENLDARLRESAEVQKIVQFADMVNLGNFATAIEFARTISPHHALVISRLEQTRVLENAKLVDLFTDNVSIDDITKFFNVKGDAEVANLTKYVDELFEVR